MYGVWNGLTKRFVYGVRELTKSAAQKKLRACAGKGAYCWRYDVRPIPEGFVNPLNNRYRVKGENK